MPPTCHFSYGQSVRQVYITFGTCRGMVALFVEELPTLAVKKQEENTSLGEKKRYGGSVNTTSMLPLRV